MPPVPSLGRGQGAYNLGAVLSMYTKYRDKLGPSPLPRAHIWPKCSVFLAVNCLPLPPGIFSGFCFMALFLFAGEGV
jgi:hypothetical protein